MKVAGALFLEFLHIFCGPYTQQLCLRRKKIKCDGIEPTCSQCATSKTQCTWLQTKDRAALSRQCVVVELNVTNV